jgi:hypothetical protein
MKSLARLFVLALLLFGAVPQQASADGGAWPTPTATVTPKPVVVPTPTPFPVVFPTPTTIGFPLGATQPPGAQVVAPTLQPTPAPKPSRFSGLALCWPFALGFILIVIIASIVLIGRRT